MSIDSTRVTIDATYYFQNILNETKSALIFYPFPIDQYHCYPDSILVFGLDYTKNDSGINFIMRFKPNSSESLKVFYSQKLKANQARYILTTTKNWKSPLKEAKFIIDIPNWMTVQKISYQPDSMVKKNNRRFYYLNKNNFLPDKDLILNW